MKRKIRVVSALPKAAPPPPPPAPPPPESAFERARRERLSAGQPTADDRARIAADALQHTLDLLAGAIDASANCRSCGGQGYVRRPLADGRTYWAAPCLDRDCALGRITNGLHQISRAVRNGENGRG